MATTLRILGKDEWDKLADWLVENVDENEATPDPLLTEVLVAEEDGEIKAVLYGAFLISFGKYNKVEGENIPDQQKMLVTLLDIYAANGLEGVPAIALAASDEDVWMLDEIGFVVPDVAVLMRAV